MIVMEPRVQLPSASDVASRHLHTHMPRGWAHWSVTFAKWATRQKITQAPGHARAHFKWLDNSFTGLYQKVRVEVRVEARVKVRVEVR